MAIKIISKQEGFMRCGIKHSAEPKVYPDDKFSKKELARLEGDKMLIVVDVPNSELKKNGKEK